MIPSIVLQWGIFSSPLNGKADVYGEIESMQQYKHTYRYRKTGKRDRKTDRQKVRQTDRQTDRRTDRFKDSDFGNFYVNYNNQK